ncbi:FAD-dependent monooxygenase [Cytophagaceae bacterium ABcell3]|nr:FAD-dependent monooxygenase [Cytophagaceae bacterium ABcell3]
MQESIDIIGAGIGGLTTALVLKQKGFRVRVYEGSSELKPVGAGIIMANNAMQVFKELGLHSSIEQAGNEISCMKITDAHLKSLSVVDLLEYKRTYGVQNTAIHRGNLQKILLDAVGLEHVVLNKRLVKVEQAQNFRLTFNDQSTVESDWLIGADGIHSVVRKQLFPKTTLRDAGQICWRGVCDMELPKKYHNELNEAWGKGRRFGFVKISESKNYWYALANAEKIEHGHLTLNELFKGFHPDILALISATPNEHIFKDMIFDLKPMDKWHIGNACLIGDAAHATTPNMGQGACQAIEDAYVLGKLIDGGLEAAFKGLELIRRKKAHAVVNTSWTIGKLAHIDNNLGVWLRNNLMKVMPKSANKKQLDMIFKLD